jgi:hypothetical protein
MFVAIHEVSRNEGEIVYKKKTIELNQVIRDSNKEEYVLFPHIIRFLYPQYFRFIGQPINFDAHLSRRLINPAYPSNQKNYFPKILHSPNSFDSSF